MYGIKTATQARKVIRAVIRKVSEDVMKRTLAKEHVIYLEINCIVNIIEKFIVKSVTFTLQLNVW